MYRVRIIGNEVTSVFGQMRKETKFESQDSLPLDSTYYLETLFKSQLKLGWLIHNLFINSSAYKTKSLDLYRNMWTADLKDRQRGVLCQTDLLHSIKLDSLETREEI